MTLYRNRPVTVQAHQWHKNGDHPADNCRMIHPDPDSATQFEPFPSEGEVVRYFRDPDIPGGRQCRKGCGHIMHDHGWIDTLEGGHIVCPGDWIITGIAGERYPCKPAVFAQTYDPADVTGPAGTPEAAWWNTPCDAGRYGDGPPSMLDGRCRCVVCPHCRHHTGNSHHGHYSAWCRITGSVRDGHFCCPQSAGGCELETAPEAAL